MLYETITKFIFRKETIIMTNEEFRNEINEVIERYVKEEIEFYKPIDTYDRAVRMLLAIAREVGEEKGVCDPVEHMVASAFYDALDNARENLRENLREYLRKEGDQ